MKKIAVVGTVGIPACYGGFESLVENLTFYKSEEVTYTVFCSSKSYKSKLQEHNNAKLIYIPLNANGIQSVVYDIFSLFKCYFLKPDAILILGVSGCCFLPFLRLFSKAKVITNIDGLEWKRDKWGNFAKWFLKKSESIAVKNSDIVVTDNKAIEEYVDEEYGIRPVTIAYGGDHAIRNIKVQPSTDSYALGLCRIEPENNVEMILESFSKSEFNLKFIGNWNSSDFGIALKERYQKCHNIDLLDPIYDLNILYSIRKNCSVYLHGHSAGGTNPSLVEMMHFQVPILAYDCSFNRYSTDNMANYFSSSDDLIDIINSLDFDKLNANALSMFKIANEKYTWLNISEKYEQLF
ncbi:glycosyl transferase [Photobacterium gaetbulicola]|uniref:Glycosyl transferase n=1 Tax=Photobacterium gaetbulicola TaxID=1295392 RepID=A0A0B9FZD2_9GAMM|nr:DUF1972 domain-containing protein [Photobacterium gaetbulicola]KHT61579.1 glycosyl transferase [Photobacterium gaetbulicola]